MSRLNHLDIVIELSELCKDLVNDTRQQLNYYRASVYKDETSRHIGYRVEKLRVVTRLIKDEVLLDAFEDHDALKKAGAAACVPGECSFSYRTTMLMTAIEKRTDFLSQQANNRNVDTVSKNLANDVKRCRRELLAMCRQGTRHWAFFQTL